MKSVDIAGLSVNGEQILAQVTYLPLAQAGHKERALLDLAGPCRRLLLFCRCDEIRLDDRVLVYPIERAFRQFTDQPDGQRWLRTVLACRRG